ncbi:3 beta-hydroxysteroid dehydrogenase/Delta 5--_4-isomerase [bacterium BMS3Abin07]|nr:3 beta-hydroxysteroid dehydrogenase/Delta 5-->4-isomerase [bacterium BMS3Abin07]HDO23031.1 NAD-dependent epimerase/dehydratase family protein [Nitrospirota bacterium]HDZ87305.1 NAD-dependent epimerase/dehydratase family protein [Nitrospirota bacterium]
MILIAGATGFVGRHLLEQLKEKPVRVRCLVRNADKADQVRALGFGAVRGDITDPSSLENALAGINTLVHLVGIIEEKGELSFRNVHVTGTENLINESIKHGVKRIIFQSALGSDINSPFNYLKTKAEAEQIIISSGIPYTIFRPSLIVGKGDGFTERVKQIISAGPAVPVPGNGTARFQPLYINDWVKCFMKVTENNIPPNRVYTFGGPEQLTYNEILLQIMKALGINKPVIHIPVNAARLALPFMGFIGSIAKILGRKIPPVTNELLSLLNRDNICDENSVENNFGFTPVRFSDALNEFITS